MHRIESSWSTPCGSCSPVNFSRLGVHDSTDWTPQRLAYSATLMACGEQTQLTERLAAVNACLHEACPHWKLGTSYAGWSKALLREGPRLLPHVMQRLRRELLKLPRSRRGRHLPFALDGTHLTCPRTAVNQAAMGDVGKPNGMPLLSLTVLLHLDTGLPWDFRVGPGIESERSHGLAMLDSLPPDALLVADAGFIGYDWCRELLRKSRHFLLRVGGNVTLLRELGYEFEVDGSTVYLWPLDCQRTQQPPLRLRLIVVQDEHKQPVYLVTSLFDPADLTDQEATEIYQQRWGIELFYRTAKQTFGHHTLHSRTPETCYQEASWSVVGVLLLGLMTARQLSVNGRDSRTWSPAGARKVVCRMLRNERPCPRTRRCFLRVLAECVKDGYHRQRPKASRSYPRKKHQKPPGPPKIRVSTQQQRQRAQQLKSIMMREQ